MTFPYYPEYKDSDVEWLGSVPAHWKVQRLRYVMTPNPSKSEARVLPSDTEVSFIPMEAIGDDGSLDLSQTRLVDDVLGGYTYVREGDVAVAKITPCFENGKAAIMRGLVNRVGFGTTELTIVRPKPSCTNSDYLFRVVTSEPFRALGEASMYGAGGQKRVPDDFVRDFRIAWPPIEEQIVIATFLDHETARIDALIEEQQRLIELLQEKRQAVISHAVTKGLDPDVPMKDSGVEWLGGIPEHWSLSRLKFEVSHVVDCLHSTPNYTEEGEYPALRTADISPGRIGVQDSKKVNRDEFLQRIVRLRPKPGDIVYSREGERYGMAATIPEGESVCLGQRVMMFRVSKDNEAEYLMWVLNSRSTYRQALQDVIGATSPHINVDTIRNFWVPAPPLEDQIRISKLIRDSLDKIDNLVYEANDSIEIMKERRSALISAAVTGKIDVRNWQPDEERHEPEYAIVAEASAAYGASP